MGLYSGSIFSSSSSQYNQKPDSANWKDLCEKEVDFGSATAEFESSKKVCQSILNKAEKTLSESQKKEVESIASDRIDKCVDYGMTNKHHVAFALEYMKYLKKEQPYKRFFNSQSELKDDIYNLIADNKEQGKILILKENTGAWCSPDFPTSFEKEQYDEEVKKNKLYYGKPSIESWKSGENCPTKYTLVQLGLYAGLNANEVNELLMKAGHQRLYALNIVDAVSMFFLNFYAEEPTEQQTAYLEKIKRTKEKINEYLTMWIAYCEKQHQPVVMVEDNIYRVPMLGEKISFEDDSNLWSMLEKAKNNNADNNLTFTKSFLLNLENCKDKNGQWDIKKFDKYMNDSLEYFSLIQYGLLLKEVSYLNDKQQIMKNVLSEKDVENIADFCSEGILLSALKNRQTQWKNREKEKKVEKIDFTKLTKIVYQNWSTKYIFTGTDTKLRSGDRATTSNIFHGRQAKKNTPGYEINLVNMYNAIKFVVSLGQEQDYRNFIERMGFIKEDEEQLYHSTLVQMEYALQYRNRLIKKCCELSSDQISELAKIEYEKNFPFILLLATINRDMRIVCQYYQNADYLDELMKTLLFNSVYQEGDEK